MNNTENKIDLNVGDVVRWSGRRNKEKIIHEFEHEGVRFFVVETTHSQGGYKELNICKADFMCGVKRVPRSGSYWDGVVEVNGKVVRGAGGVLLSEPKEVKKKNLNIDTKKLADATLESIMKYGEFGVTKSDFKSFVKVQRSGQINMNDIVTGARLANITEDKYEFIMWNYQKCKDIFKI